MATATLPLVTLIPAAHEDDSTRVRLDSGTVVDLDPVQSSRVRAVGYDEETATLFLQFPTGVVYAYDGVEQDVYEQLVTAESIGRFANEHIIGTRQQPSRYKYRKVVAEGDVPPLITVGRSSTGIRIVEDPLSHPLRIVEAPPAARVKQPTAEPEASGPSSELPEDDAKLPEFAIAAKTAAAALTVVDARRQMILPSPEAYSAAETKLVALKRERDLVEQRVLRVYDPAYRTYIEARTLRDEALRPYDDAERMLKSAMLAYCRKEEADRREAEAAQRRELERKALEDARQQGREEADRQAAYLEAQGEIEEAAHVRATPVPVAPAPVPAVVLPSAVPSSGKASRKAKWNFRIVDEREIPVTFAPAIESIVRDELKVTISREQAGKIARALGPVFAEFYVLDEKALRERANRLKHHANIAGVEVFDEGTIAVRKG